jgi:hypothetical protein
MIQFEKKTIAFFIKNITSYVLILNVLFIEINYYKFFLYSFHYKFLISYLYD